LATIKIFEKRQPKDILMI